MTLACKTLNLPSNHPPPPPTIIKDLLTFLMLSWAWNCTFLMISGPWNKAEPFGIFQAPDFVKICQFQRPQWVKKALIYFRSLKASIRYNFRPMKSSSSASFWNWRLNFYDWCNSTHFTTKKFFKIYLISGFVLDINKEIKKEKNMNKLIRMLSFLDNELIAFSLRIE